jgi:hypothetical protein
MRSVRKTPVMSKLLKKWSTSNLWILRNAVTRQRRRLQKKGPESKASTKMETRSIAGVAASIAQIAKVWLILKAAKSMAME